MGDPQVYAVQVGEYFFQNALRVNSRKLDQRSRPIYDVSVAVGDIVPNIYFKNKLE